MNTDKELDDFIREIQSLPDVSKENKKRLDVIEKQLRIKKRIDVIEKKLGLI